MNYYCLIPGSKFNKLTILDRVEVRKENDSKRYVRCKCDCGNIKVIAKISVTTGKTKSCGCAQKEWTAIRIPHNKLPPGISASHSAYRHYKDDAGYRKLEWDLTLEDFLKITQKLCYYCGSLPANVCKTSNNNGNFVYNGIDRVDSKQGYILINCVPCCADCNYMKHEKSISSFLIKCEKIYKFVNIKNASRERIWEYYEQE